MTSLTPLLLLVTAFASAISHAGELTQVHKDLIREHQTKQILRTGKPITILQPDMQIAREMFAVPNDVEARVFVEPDPVPWVQLFKKHDMTLGETLRILAAAAGYDLEIHPQVDLNQIIKLNGQQNSLRDVAEYLSRISTAHIVAYNEARVLTVNRKYQ